jgi:hypothetical protein
MQKGQFLLLRLRRLIVQGLTPSRMYGVIHYACIPTIRMLLIFGDLGGLSLHLQ